MEGRMYRCCKAASTISSPTARANCSTAPAKAASTCSSCRAGRSTAHGNVNLVSIGDYAHPKVRFPGSFGSAYLYYVVPKVILFRTEHSRRTLVPKVDFISAPGANAPNVYPHRRADRARHQPLPVLFRRRAFHAGQRASRPYGRGSDREHRLRIRRGPRRCRRRRRPRRRRLRCCARWWRRNWPRSIRSSRRRCSAWAQPAFAR